MEIYIPENYLNDELVIYQLSESNKIESEIIFDNEDFSSDSNLYIPVSTLKHYPENRLILFNYDTDKVEQFINVRVSNFIFFENSIVVFNNNEQKNASFQGWVSILGEQRQRLKSGQIYLENNLENIIQ